MAHPLSIRLDDDLAARLERLARLTGRSKSFYVKQAIESHIEDLEDLYAAQQVAKRVAEGRERLIPLEQVERELGLADRDQD
jgi:RHH-type transcriptional regulator, rel operon repressor / antitoxin RelB